MKITVLGATGQIGSVIHNGLRNRQDIVGTSRKPGAKCIQFDPFRDNWSLLDKTDVLINCVGQIEATKNSSFYDVHIGLTKLIIKNRELIGNPRIIQLSALGASTRHEVEFLRTKGIADDLLLQYPDTIVVRPSIVCTHQTMIVKKMLMLNRMSRLTRGIVLVPKGFLQTRIQPVMPEDLVGVIHSLCGSIKPQKGVDLVGPQPLSFKEIVTMMFKTRDMNLRLIEIPKIICDAAVICCISVFFPKVINSQQYQLLFADNVADSFEIEKMLHRPLLSPLPFFINEFNNARN